MRQDIIFNVEVDIGGRRLALSELIVRADLDDIRPPTSSPDPWTRGIEEDARERRRRFTDMLAGNFAHALTEALFENKSPRDVARPAERPPGTYHPHMPTRSGRTRARGGIEKMDFPS